MSGSALMRGSATAASRSRSGGRRRTGRVFDTGNAVILLIIGLLCVYPFLYVISVSLSDGARVASGDVVLWPQDFNLETYRYIFTAPRLGIVRSTLNSILYTVVGTVLAVLLTFMTAYVLSRKGLRGRYLIMMLFLISWIFEAGLIPTYLVNKTLGLVDNWLVMIIPGAISTFLLIITRSFLEAIPDELEESASIDGANAFSIMWRIYLPLSVPVLATIAIFYAVSIWNSFLIPLIYLQDKALHPIQLTLYSLLIAKDPSATTLEQITVNGHLILPSNLSAAVMVIAILPIVAAYPFAQRYFQKGIMIGAVKG